LVYLQNVTYRAIRTAQKASNVCNRIVVTNLKQITGKINKQMQQTMQMLDNGESQVGLMI